jgi:hypothetical protein
MKYLLIVINAILVTSIVVPLHIFTAILNFIVEFLAYFTLKGGFHLRSTSRRRWAFKDIFENLVCNIQEIKNRY